MNEFAKASAARRRMRSHKGLTWAWGSLAVLDAVVAALYLGIGMTFFGWMWVAIALAHASLAVMNRFMWRDAANEFAGLSRGVS